ncbi:MAG TPA: diguanylate cyclase [Caulobacteraceae bacterium]|nr:diguanylate cyclase [Caulobacteraceae bacterium]
MGLLTADALLAMVNERRLTEALNRNPLTRLPGNTAVASRISEIVAQGCAPQPVRHICYFDFDHFKPFNDCKGFRLGDRVIVLFAEAMQRHLGALPGSFVGHLGGDDFVCTLSDQDSDGLRRLLRNLLFEFSDTVAGLYDEEERVRGWIESEGGAGGRRLACTGRTRLDLRQTESRRQGQRRGDRVGTRFPLARRGFRLLAQQPRLRLIARNPRLLMRGELYHLQIVCLQFANAARRN